MAIIIVLTAMALCFGLLVRQYYTAAKSGAGSLAKLAACKRNLKHLNTRHWTGGAAMAVGAGTYFTLPQAQAGWLLPRLQPDYAAVTVALSLAAFALSYQQGLYNKRIVNGAFGNSNAGTYLLVRAGFLMVYEVFFRIALLGAALLFVFPVMAVALNITLYAVAHLFSPRREALLSVPFGLLLCWLTLVHQSVWPATILHLLLSLPYEIILLTHRKKQIHTYAS